VLQVIAEWLHFAETIPPFEHESIVSALLSSQSAFVLQTIAVWLHFAFAVPPFAHESIVSELLSLQSLLLWGFRESSG
jgi:hypothetical protein